MPFLMEPKLGWVQDSRQAPKLIPSHPLAKIYTWKKVITKFDIHRDPFFRLEALQLARPSALRAYARVA